MDVQKYKILYKEGEAEISEKKSRFIAHIAPAQTEEEAQAFIEKIKKQYWDARHNCWAYSIGEKQPALRCSDDGEPSGTAGKPMLEVLTGQELHNVVAVVTRYFGGILLGTGGLVRNGRIDPCVHKKYARRDQGKYGDREMSWGNAQPHL